MATTEGLPASWPLPTKAQQELRMTPATKALNDAARSNVAGESAPVGRMIVGPELDNLRGPLVGLLEQMFPAANPTTLRKRQDIEKRLEEMYQKLQAGMCNEATIGQVGQLAGAIAQQDFATANRVHMELSKMADYRTHKNWLMGLKFLLPR